MRRKIIAGNWKMNCGNPADAVELAAGLAALVGNVDDRDMILCPPFTALVDTVKAVDGTKIDVGAQNMYHEESGAYTGETSPDFLLNVGCKYVIIGHSERRAYFCECNALVNKKVKFALEKGITPIMCLGETLEERQADKTRDVVKDHVTGGLAGLSAEEAQKVVLAYEPVWAIGTGVTAEPEDAESVHKYIREVLTEMFDADTAQIVRIQYGGSVKPDNANELLSKPDIDGALVGGASLKADSFAKIIEYDKQ